MSAEHKNKPSKAKKKFSRPRPQTPSSAGTFKESLFDSLGDDFAGKLRKSVEDNQKKKIRELMAKPEVQKAAEEFAKDAPKK